MIAWLAGVVVLFAGLILCGLAWFTAWTARRVEKQVPPVGRFIDVDGARIHYLDEGSGPVVLLVHGLAGQVHTFTYSLLGKLLQHGFRVVILDRPGSGYSTRPPQASATLEAQAGIVSRFCEKLALKRPLVVGHSLGGSIAMALALSYPEQVAGLALVAPVAELPDRMPPPFDSLLIASSLLRRLIAWTIATPLWIVNGKRMAAMLFSPEPIPRGFAIKGGGLLSLRPTSFIGASTDLVAMYRETFYRCEDLTVPVGILFGASDRILDPSVHGRGLAAKVKHAELELIDGGGHMLPVTAPDRTAAFIARMAKRSAAADNTLALAAQG